MCTAPRVEDLNLIDVDTVAVDLETHDPELKKERVRSCKRHRKGMWYRSLYRETNMLFSHSACKIQII